MGKSRLDMRREAEAAEARDKQKGKEKAAKPKTAKEPAKRKTTTRRTREKPPERKRAVWVIYSGSMKEEGRYPYDQKKAAEERLEQLRQRSKRLYFMQMVKELITSEKVVQVVPPIDEELPEEFASEEPVAEDEEGIELELEETELAEEEEEEEEEAEPADEEE